MSQRNAGGAPKYYDTKREASAFVADIQELLTEYGAASFMVEMEQGRASAIAFQMGELAYRIRPDVEAMADRLTHGRKGRAAADTVAWAQARHLLELQLEAIETRAARASEVLGGYVLMADGRTVGDMIEEQETLPGGARLMLTAGSS